MTIPERHARHRGLRRLLPPAGGAAWRGPPRDPAAEVPAREDRADRRAGHSTCSSAIAPRRSAPDHDRDQPLHHEPIAKLLDIEVLLATDPEIIDGRFTGCIAGIPNFREGKLARLKQWQGDRRFAGMSVYSDSHNDLPLLEAADQPVAVDPDDRLRAHAQRRGWPIITLRDLSSVMLAE